MQVLVRSQASFYSNTVILFFSLSYISCSCSFFVFSNFFIFRLSCCDVLLLRMCQFPGDCMTSPEDKVNHLFFFFDALFPFCFVQLKPPHQFFPCVLLTWPGVLASYCVFVVLTALQRQRSPSFTLLVYNTSCSSYEVFSLGIFGGEITHAAAPGTFNFFSVLLSVAYLVSR